MKIQELRIGNYILDGGEFATVELINGEMEEVYFKGPKTYLSENIQYIVPIPINEEWLLKFGFKKSEEKWDYLIRVKYNDFSIIKNDEYISFNICQYGHINSRIKHIKYVHQLQNLYFALTGTELDYEKETK